MCAVKPPSKERWRNGAGSTGQPRTLDVSSDATGFVCRVERYDPGRASGFLRVSWNAVARPPGYEPVAGSAVYVDVPPGFEHRIYEARPDIADSSLAWVDNVFGDGLMLVVILPYGHALPNFHDAHPQPVAAKLHQGRMALYWLHTKRTRTIWRMEVVGGTDFRAVLRVEPGGLSSGSGVSDDARRNCKPCRGWSLSSRSSTGRGSDPLS